MPVCLVHQDLPDICGMYSTIFMCNKENQVEIVHIQNFQIVMVKSRLQTCQLLQERKRLIYQRSDNARFFLHNGNQKVQAHPALSQMRG